VRGGRDSPRRGREWVAERDGVTDASDSEAVCTQLISRAVNFGESRVQVVGWEGGEEAEA
jgi:hypothetical protein